MKVSFPVCETQRVSLIHHVRKRRLSGGARSPVEGQTSQCSYVVRLYPLDREA